MCAIIAVMCRVGRSRILKRRWQAAAATCTWGARLLLLVVACLCGCGTPPNPDQSLRTVSALRRLGEGGIAAGRRVELRGAVTLLDPTWRLLVVQDDTGGILVEWPPPSANLRVGDRVEVQGTTSVDNHVPSIVGASVRVVGTGLLPHPQPASADAIACGAGLYQLVEVELKPEQGSLGDSSHTALLASRQSCGRLEVIGALLRGYSPGDLAGRWLRVRGVPLAFYSPSGSLDHVRLMFDDESDVTLLDALPPVGTPGLAAAGASPEIHSLQAIKELPRTEASRGFPVRVEGVVTALNPRYYGYVLQQGSVGVCIFLTRPQDSSPRVGQRVLLSGVTARGGFAPVIVQSSMEVLGTSPLPMPVQVQPGDIFHGWEENLRVEVEGIGAAVTSDNGSHQLELFSGPRRVSVWFSEESSPEKLQRLVNSRLRVQGVYSPLYTASGSLVGFRIFSTSPDAVKVLDLPKASSTFRSIASLSQFDLRGTPQGRFQTAGAVTYRDSRGRLYLQDGDSALRVIGNGPGDPGLNAWVTVEGVMSPDAAQPQLEHVRWLNEKPGAPVRPAATPVESLVSGDFTGRLVTVEAFLVNRHTSGGELQLSMMAGPLRFSAAMEAPESSGAFPDLRPGSLLRLTGVCETLPWGLFGGSHLASLSLRNAKDITVVRPAPWWDLQRVAYAAFAASLLLILLLAWVLQLRHNLVGQMALRSKLEDQLLHAQKLESVGRLAGGVAHDFNNYLTVILGYTSLLLDSFPDVGRIRKQLMAISDVAQRAASLTRQLLAFSRKQVLQPVPCDPNEMITEAKTSLLPLIGEHIEIVIRQNKVDPVSIDPAQFLQVLINIALNARDAMPNGGKLIFETANAELRAGDVRFGDDLRPGPYVCISIADTGAGMDDATRQRIFEPFFTTKERGRGTGLGLAVVFGIVKQSNGQIEVESKPGQGSRFRVYLPATVVEAPLPERRAQRTEATGTEIILVVEDEPAVRTLLCTELQGRGYKVLEAAGPREALKLLEDPAVSVHLLLTDLVMPDMSGRALAAEATRKRPGLRVLYMSGYSGEVFADQSAGGQAIAYLEKPFNPSQAAAAVRRVLDDGPQ